MPSVHKVLSQLRTAATSNRDLGTKFEILIKAFLKADPVFRERFADVWLWNEWPDRGRIGDTGIDLVAKDALSDGYCAIQCKFYEPDHTLSKEDIDSFFTASGKAPFTSRLIVSTTDLWGSNAEEAIRGQTIPVTRLSVHDLQESEIDWERFEIERPQDITIKTRKTPLPHQREALRDVCEGFAKHPRGKLIMACGTGKTFTSLKIAEDPSIVAEGGAILFLVPSISLLSQSLREWTAQAEAPLQCFAVCSDPKVNKVSRKTATDLEDISVVDLAFPATTDGKALAKRFKAFRKQDGLNVVFSTYQSIDAVCEAQKSGMPEFDLIICDEAHRTAGVTLVNEEDSQFVKVHDQKTIRGKKRLYMTATPRVFADGAKTQAKEADAELYSMDDETRFGPEFHRLGFGSAVERGLLTDYQVLVLAVDEKYVSSAFQDQFAHDGELRLEDTAKITGCWNGLSKRIMIDEDGAPVPGDEAPMRRAVAFCRSIEDSKRIASIFTSVIEKYRSEHEPDEFLDCELAHVDGTMNSLVRNAKLDWLKQPTKGNTCRILTNARCLSEGVDVPALDAILLLHPRKSVIDVIQSVGRVMRRAPGKKRGYIILPVGIPADTSPEDALAANERFRVVWQVLQALRAHDERLDATINQIELNKRKPDQIQIIGIGGDDSDDGRPGVPAKKQARAVQLALNFPNLDAWRDAIYARIVKKCGDRRYWESWAKDIAQIAQNHITRIKGILDGKGAKNSEAGKNFDTFLESLRENLNPSVSREDAIEMLAQHMITRPVFDALFEAYPFTQRNPVSRAMQQMLELLQEKAVDKEAETLERFYKSVRDRVSGLDNDKARQDVVRELYDTFFNTAFERLADRLGIVYTPVEVVDFICHSTDAALRKEFGIGITDKDVHVLDPFTGTGTFMVRLIQSGLIKKRDLTRKYLHELHANEIVLLAYYVAAINIESAYHEASGEDYEPFNGIVLTDTFQIDENKSDLIERLFPENNKRTRRQKEAPIRVIIGNPPYSAGQKSENEANRNLKYPRLDERIRQTYVEHSTASNKNSIYDAYIRAFRWASDRIKDKGVICYVSNGAFIDGGAADGMRKCLADEFTSIYVFNLRGNARTQGEERRKEKGNVFGEGSRTPIAVTLLVKNPEKKGACELFYHDIGNYLTREEKLEIIASARSTEGLMWERIHANDKNDWVGQRDPAFDSFLLIGGKDDAQTNAIFSNYSLGVMTNRDPWVCGFSKKTVASNAKKLVEFYNSEVQRFLSANNQKSNGNPGFLDKFLNNDPKLISWTSSLKQDLERGKLHKFDHHRIVTTHYRPFCKSHLYFHRSLNERVYRLPALFPTPDHKNLVISITGVAERKGFSCLITEEIPNRHLLDTNQCFPLYWYESEAQSGNGDLFSQKKTGTNGYIRHEGISDWALQEFRGKYEDKKISREDIFYYVYALLHSPEYKSRFDSDLKKTLPRIPLAKDFWAFSKAGRALAKWHLNYETVKPFPLEEISTSLNLDPKRAFRVEKMAFAKNGKTPDKSTILYNSGLTLKGIPAEAYEYVVNGKPAIESVMERYAVSIDADSGIRNDPNDWSDDPRYIVDLVKRVVRVSIETVKIVKSLPPLEEMA